MRLSDRRGPRAGLATALAGALLLAGCTGGDEPAPTPSGTATPRPFTVASTDRVRTTDPAAVTDQASAMFVLNVFQRVVSAEPGASVLTDDAGDCIFSTPTTYTCTLKEDLEFTNGHPLTSSDVKFSIERAARLDVPGSSASLLDTLRRIETPDARTVRFLLSRPDTQFGWALASPAASIVDEDNYDPDTEQRTDEPVVGSGPFAVTRFTDDTFDLVKFTDYVGRTPAGIAALEYRSLPDSAALEDAMNAGEVDVVWRGLDDAAVTRLSQQATNADGRTANGFVQQVRTGLRVRQLVWDPASSHRSDKALRAAVGLALQGDRTSDSVVPGGVPGHVGLFAMGGRSNPKVTWDRRITLSLGYDTTMPDGQDVANQIRTRLEDTGGLSVRLRPDATGDLTLVDRKAWTATALAWLQPYVDAPLAGSAEEVEATEQQFRSTYDDEAGATALLATLQQQAAADLVMLPVSQSDEYLYLRDGVELTETSFGPGWQLGFWGLRRG